MDPTSGTYSGSSLDAALKKASAGLGVPVEEIEHETLLGSDASGHVLIRARVKAATSPLVGFAERLLAALDCPAKVKATPSAEALDILVLTPEAARLQAEPGHLFRALTHIVAKVGEKIEPGRKVRLDVQAEEEERESALEKIAQIAIERCHRYGRSVALPPMNPYERRIVHMAVREHSDLSTESMGVGRGRRIVVSPRAQQARAEESAAQSQEASGDTERGGDG